MSSVKIGCCCGAEITAPNKLAVLDFEKAHEKCVDRTKELESRDTRIAELESIVEQLKRQSEQWAGDWSDAKPVLDYLTELEARFNVVSSLVGDSIAPAAKRLEKEQSKVISDSDKLSILNEFLSTPGDMIQVTSLHNGNTARILASHVYAVEEFDYQAGGEPVKATRMYIDGGNRFDAVEPYEEVYLKLGWPTPVDGAASSPLPDEAEDDVAEVGVSGGVVVPYPASSRKCCLCGFAFKTDQPHLVVNDCLYYCQSCYDDAPRLVEHDADEAVPDRVRQIIDDVNVDSGFVASGKDTAKGQQSEHKCAKCEHVFAMTEACEKVGDDYYCFTCYDRKYRV